MVIILSLVTTANALTITVHELPAVTVLTALQYDTKLTKSPDSRLATMNILFPLAFLNHIMVIC